MRRNWCVIALAVVLAAPLGAQEPTLGAEPDDPGRAAELRQRIEDRFALRVKEQLGLNDEQLAKLRATTGTYGARRRDLEAQERQVRSSLAGQMRPGVAANQDSVSKLTDALLNIRSSYAQTFREENREMSGYLTPVQRSQLFAMRERLMRRVQQIREQRRAEGGRAWRRPLRDRPPPRR